MHTCARILSFADYVTIGADVDPGIWAMVENWIGIVSACLPTLGPVYNLVTKGLCLNLVLALYHVRSDTHFNLGHLCNSQSCSRCGASKNSSGRPRRALPVIWPGSKSSASAQGARSHDSYFDLERQTLAKSQPMVDVIPLEDRASDPPKGSPTVEVL